MKTVNLDLAEQAIIIVALRELLARYQADVIGALTVRDEKAAWTRYKHAKEVLTKIDNLI